MRAALSRNSVGPFEGLKNEGADKEFKGSRTCGA
jgi:hypothetical protein